WLFPAQRLLDRRTTHSGPLRPLLGRLLGTRHERSYHCAQCSAPPYRRWQSTPVVARVARFRGSVEIILSRLTLSVRHAAGGRRPAATFHIARRARRAELLWSDLTAGERPPRAPNGRRQLWD